MDIYRCPHCRNTFQAAGPGNYRCPSCDKEVQVKRPVLTDVPWDKESKGDWAGAFYSTLKASLVDPVSFFQAVAKGQGFLRPLVYAVIISMVVFIVAAAYQAGFGFLELAPQLAGSLKQALFPALISGPLLILFFGILGLIGVPIAAGVGLLIEAALFHLGLLILGSARRDFTATFRTVCYCMGPHVFQVIPLLGGMVSGIWVIVLCVIGIKTVHETTYTRSTLVVFLPLILCCGLLILFLVTIAGGVFAALITNP